MAKKNPIGFSKRVLNYARKYSYKKEILNALKSSPEIRSEISRIFQVANRRIQNIEDKGLVSPAVMSLNKGDVVGYTKFSMRMSWDDLKIEYAKAVAFLNQPTSTARGTDEYNAHLKAAYNLSDDEFRIMEDHLKQRIVSVSDVRFLEQYLLRYKDFTGELEMEARDVSSQIESEATIIESSLDRKMKEEAKRASKDVESAVQRILSQLEHLGIL